MPYLFSVFFFGILYTWFFIVSTTNFDNIHTSPLSHSQNMLKSEIRGNPSVICRSSTILDTQNKILGYFSSDTRNYRSNEFYAFVDRIFILSKVCLRKMKALNVLSFIFSWMNQPWVKEIDSKDLECSYPLNQTCHVC